MSSIVQKSWGYEVIFADNELYRGKILHIYKGKSIHLQYHKEKDETMYILKGQGYMVSSPQETFGKFVKVNSGEEYRIPPMTIHKVWAVTDLEIVEVSNVVPDTDVIHLED